MIQLANNEGQVLDYDGKEFTLTRQACSFLDFKMAGDYSVNFKISNSPYNREVLNYYGAMQVNRPTKVPMNILQDGNIVKTGNLVIKSSGKDIECFFISGNSNWFQNLDFNIKDIIFPDNLTVLASAIDTQKTATEGIIFPLVDWWGRGEMRSSTRVISQSPSTNDPPPINDLQPCLYLHTIVKHLATTSNIQIAGDLLEDALFKKIIITPTGPDQFVPDSLVERSFVNLGVNATTIYNDALDPQPAQFVTILDGQGQVDLTTYAYTAPYTGTYNIKAQFYFSPAVNYNVTLYVNGAPYSALSAGTDFNMIFFANFVKGDRVQFYVDRITGVGAYRLNEAGAGTGVVTVEIKLEKRSAAYPRANISGYSPVSNVGYVIPNVIVPDMTGVDLIKFLSVFFACVVTYDEYSKTIYINKIANFRKEDAEDWSEYFVSSITKWGGTKNNFIQTSDGTEDEIVAYNEQSLLRYGGGNIQTDFDEQEKRDLYTLPFSGSWDAPNQTALKFFMPSINFYDVEFGQQVAYSAVVNAAGISQFTCTFNEPIDVNKHVFYVVSASGFYSGFATAISAGTLTNPQLHIPFVASDTGTITICTLSKVDGPNRMLISYPGKNLTDANGPSSFDSYVGISLIASSATGVLAWYDKPLITDPVSAPINIIKESLSLDSIRDYNTTVSERYYAPVKSMFNSPVEEANFLLPVAVANKFDFRKYIYIKSEDLTGYFFLQKMYNYKDSVTEVKTDLLIVE